CFPPRRSSDLPLMFMSISLVKKLPVFRQNTELTNKTRQNIAHQHTEAAVRGASPVLPSCSFRVMDTFSPVEADPLPTAYYRYMEKSVEDLEADAEYDMDEEDVA